MQNSDRLKQLMNQHSLDLYLILHDENQESSTNRKPAINDSSY